MQIAFTTVPWALLKTSVMMIGEFEYEALFLENQSPSDPQRMYYPEISAIIFILFLILMSVLIMNLLVRQLLFMPQWNGVIHVLSYPCLSFRQFIRPSISTSVQNLFSATPPKTIHRIVMKRDWIVPWDVNRCNSYCNWRIVYFLGNMGRISNGKQWIFVVSVLTKRPRHSCRLYY